MWICDLDLNLLRSRLVKNLSACLETDHFTSERRARPATGAGWGGGEGNKSRNLQPLLPKKKNMVLP